MGEDGPYYDLAEQDAEITSLRAELAMKERELEGQTLLYQDAVNDIAAAKQRIAELAGALEHNNSALDGANAIIAKLEIERWKRCPSTHCVRRGECASPHECIVKPKPPELKAATRAKLAAAKQRIAKLLALLASVVSRAEKAEAELDISREAHRMVQSALLSQAAETERAEAERDAMRELVKEAAAFVWSHAKSPEDQDLLNRLEAIKFAALAPSPAGEKS